MPYKDKDKQREYQRLWRQQRHDEFFVDKVCVRCGSEENLRLDHINPKLKIDHRIWSWSQARREQELEKCQVLCYDCHVDKTVENYEHAYGEDVRSSKLTEEKVIEILQSTISNKQLAALYNVDESNIRAIKKGRSWKHLHKIYGSDPVG